MENKEKPDSTTATTKEEPKGTAKREYLRKVELEVQKTWDEQNLFEINAPEDNSKPKYLGTFPYPYMNGRLHLGHTFTLTKVEFATGYQRLKGKNVLFPFAFHCTGMPIKACADKLKREMELYGNPPQFPAEEEEEKPKEEVKATKADPLAFHAQKSKVKAKSGKGAYQWTIMRSLGISDEEIAKFADAYYWLSYFPPYCKEDMQKMGVGVDWRRSFITTDVNKYYDSFVRWQFETLKERNKVQFGKRYTIYSPKDGQPCADHDRQSGEGVLPQEYTLIKLEVVAPFPEKLKPLEGKKVYLVPGTLRPETMYGQTNCWVLPDGEYGAFEVNETEVFICTERSARNMAFQFLSKVPGQVSCLMSLKGWDLLGLPLKAPLSKYPVVYTLPMLTISPTKGTGIVTSVPSDSPDDFINLEELKRKPAFRAKFSLTDEMVMPFEVVPIINIPELGNTSAATVCESLKIKSPNDKALLEQAKDTVYLSGFAKGVMLVGEHKDTPVKDAKPLIKDMLIATGQAVNYSEPADVVMSRSGDECVVSLTDQWFLDYGEEKWRELVENHLKSNVDTYSEDTHHKFEIALQWLNQWACSRTYGLGTKLPWDEQYLIDSLSDSTIYMAFYTVAHLLQGGVIDGSKTGQANIKPEQMTRKVWDYIYLKGAYPADCGIPEETLQRLRHEFEYWYPVDIRVSGKDLINNHLVFFLYNHAAMWPEQAETRWPRSIRANGHTLLNGDKMSKSTGNFLTLTDAIDKYSADGMRFALADAGDSLEDANFTDKTADTAILRLYTQLHWVQETLASLDTLRAGPPSTFMDSVFASSMAKSIKETDHHYDRTNFREALRTGFFDMQTHRDNYRVSVGTDGMNRELILRFIEVQAILLAPITPHFSEYIWKLLGKSGSVRFASWPEAGTVNEEALRQMDYLQNLTHSIRIRKDYYMKPKGKKGEKPQSPPQPTKTIIAVALRFPDWMEKTLNVLRPLFEAGTPDEKEIAKLVQQDAELKKVIKKVMPYVAQIKKDFQEKGLAALNLTLPFDEKEFIQNNASYIVSQIGVPNLEVVHADEEVGEKASPGSPYITFGNDPSDNK